MHDLVAAGHRSGQGLVVDGSYFTLVTDDTRQGIVGDIFDRAPTVRTAPMVMVNASLIL